MKGTKQPGILAWPPSPARMVALAVAGLVCAGLVAVALSPEFRDQVWSSITKPRVALSWAASAALWGLALVLGATVRRSGRAEGRWQTAGILALHMIAAAGLLLFGMILAGPLLDSLVGAGNSASIIFNSFSIVFGSLPTADPVTIVLAVSLATAGLFVLSALAWRIGARVRHGMAVVLVLIPAYVYLVRDDAELRDPIELAEFAPHGADAVAANAILMRWSSTSERARAFKGPELFRRSPVPALDSAQWVDLIAENRGEVAEAWAEILPVRTWWTEWNGYPAVADTSNAFANSIPSFNVMRLYARVACAEATALALEARGDEAVDVLIPLIEGAGKIQAHSVAMTRAMTAVVLRGMALDTAGLVLDRGKPGPAARARLREAMSATQSGEEGIRRMVGGEFALQLQMFRSMETSLASSEVSWFDWCLSSLLFNPRRTCNEINDVVSEMMERAARRDEAGVASAFDRNIERSRHRFSIKNQLGRQLIMISLPSSKKVIGNYWKTEDATSALIARLAESGAAKPAEAVQP